MIPVGFKAVTKRNPCPVCGKPDWCLIHVAGDYAICPRTAAGAIRLWGEAGYLHQVVTNGNGQGESLPSYGAVFPRQTKWPELVRVFRHAAIGELVEKLAFSLGVTAVSLVALDIGLTNEAWTFPMYSKPGTVCGIRYRAEDGRKWAVRGSRNGVFAPTLRGEGSLLICEGPTDTAVVLDFGYEAIGRASCLSNLEQMPAFAAGRDVVVVADGDAVGLRGATKMAMVLRSHCSSVCVIRPPDGIKDARAWKCAGATRTDLERAILAARIMD